MPRMKKYKARVLQVPEHMQEVEALQVDPRNTEPYDIDLGVELATGQATVRPDGRIVVVWANGYRLTAWPGDWVARDLNGTLHIFNREAFEKSFEPKYIF